MAEKKERGRPSKFNDSVREKILELCKKGKTNAQIAEVIGVHVVTLEIWMGKHQDLRWAAKEAKQAADELVEASLFRRAVGFSHESEKVFCHEGKIIRAKVIEQYAPDARAGEFWLKNRLPDRWREKTPGESPENPLHVRDESKLTDQELDARIEAHLKKRGKK